MTAVLLLIVGACLLVAGVGVLLWPAGVAVAGLVLIVAGYDLSRP